MPKGGGVWTFSVPKYNKCIVLPLKKMTTRGGNDFSEFGRPKSNSPKARGMINTYTIILIRV